MKAFDIILAVLCIASLVAVYFAGSPEMRILFDSVAVICAAVIGARAGMRMRNKGKKE
jgi:tetrahydromethanopterin S-methyltransferase subunit C